MFSHNGVIKPESNTTRMFRPVRQVAAPVGRRTTLFGRVRYLTVLGAKSAISDCVLFKC